MILSRLSASCLLSTAIVVTVLGVRAASAQANDTPQFNRDIRPILSDRCFSCHGNDKGNRKAELRLDIEEAATEWAILPGDWEGSEVIARVSSDDLEYRMPP